MCSWTVDEIWSVIGKGILCDARHAGQATRSCLPWVSSCACTALHHILDCVVENESWYPIRILFMVSGAVVGAVAFHMPALAEHFIDEVHEFLVVEGIEIFALFEFQLWMLVIVYYSSALIVLLLSLASIISIVPVVSVISIP